MIESRPSLMSSSRSSLLFFISRDNDWDFMPARVWIGLWTSGLILLIVIFNLSALVKYITRFTEESFATLIAVIFIVESFNKLFEIETDHPVNFDPDKPIPENCTCLPPPCDNATAVMEGLFFSVLSFVTFVSISLLLPLLSQ